MLALLQFFTFLHLPAELAAIAQPFAELAHRLAEAFGNDNPQAITAVQRLLEAKDCAVRAHILKAGEPTLAPTRMAGTQPPPPPSQMVPGTPADQLTQCKTCHNKVKVTELVPGGCRVCIPTGAGLPKVVSSRCHDCFSNTEISPISGLCPVCEARMRAKGARL